ncbi:unnamed protein product [Notodromas monacha]|uniref:Uncharacterized protein n=1 Tax=Notodromas monacha TaxID=399045 RepID=A0A7R9GI97_9CRUS|nr:unnamed protein product [Notodromas monacha]CAG0922368.1 unnamed protein product [Notodromas monacha]
MTSWTCVSTCLVAFCVVVGVTDALIWCESCGSPSECRHGPVQDIRCFHSNSCMVRFDPANHGAVTKKGCGGTQFNAHCKSFMMPGIKDPVTECYCGPYDLCNSAAMTVSPSSSLTVALCAALSGLAATMAAPYFNSYHCF